MKSVGGILIEHLSNWRYIVSQKTSHLWLAIILTYTIPLQYLLAQMLLRKY